MTHDLKTWPEFFSAVKADRKSFEVRKVDRNFNTGDVLRLREWVQCPKCGGLGRTTPDDVTEETCENCKGSTGWYTGNELFREVTYILRGPKFGLDGVHCIMSISKLRGNQ